MNEGNDVGRIINTVIKSFASENIIFSNESQFQFDLAWKLQENDYIRENYDIKLEVLGLSKERDQIKKHYIDMVLVSKKEGILEFIPIELKFKTPQRELEYFMADLDGKEKPIGRTFSQGAPDVGSYLFWRDVERLERVKDEIIILDGYENYKMKKGYAVIMTNCPSYLIRNNGLYSDFFPYDGFKTKNHIKQDGVLRKLCGKVYVHMINGVEERCKENEYDAQPKYIITDNDIRTYMGKEGFNDALLIPITISGSYECEWDSYPLGNNCFYIFRNKKHFLENNTGGRDYSFCFLMLEI